MRVFLDSDVVISSLLSDYGAANILVNSKSPEFYISNISEKEIKTVAKRLSIQESKMMSLIKNKLKTVKVEEDLKSIKQKFGGYTTDPDDAHIVAGAASAKVRFLISYNVKDFKAEKIKRSFDIILMKPATFLQYLRSI